MSLFDYGSEGLSLVPLSQEHTEMVHVYASKPTVKKYIGWSLMRTLAETAEYVDTLMDRHKAGSHIYASVMEKRSGRVVGTVMIFSFDKVANHGEIGYVLDDTVWGKGYGTQLVNMMSDFVFQELGLRKVFARIVDANIGSARVLEKNGYALEAELKDYYLIEGCYMSCMFYSRYTDAVK